jgi:hypothetical protein
LARARQGHEVDTQAVRDGAPGRGGEDVNVYWYPWAAKWLEHAARRRDLDRAHKEGKIKDALKSAARRKRRKQRGAQ